ncbi:SH3 domain-containing protein [Cyanobacterium stanieri LEGE 03274]|uniref:SH3 domain-containing protein n=1 Tax=Cyanobacterium stanieri LEGE 03274 TaxID=1828756 RepID=A0ABR9V550_9CHRO|nr:SH3 domain-containing protein [Cyanobacterium stanieri]MBE9223007.1 SH3 domain-containing protein [Cyanobacterium stanieri LEGE 03274]
MNKILSTTIKSLVIATTALASLTIPYGIKPNAPALAQNNRAVVNAPPSNVRATPNGRIICRVRNVRVINIYGENNGWYVTDACGTTGYIHHSQIRFENVQRGSGVRAGLCYVTNIRTGQLAVRHSPGGESFAGLNNGNTVQYIRGNSPWYLVTVINGPNSAVNNRTGWVNANYLDCY